MCNLVQGNMVSAHGDGGSGNSKVRSASQIGPETTHLHRELLLQGASRYVIREKLIELAQHYIGLTDEGKDPERSVIQDD